MLKFSMRRCLCIVYGRRLQCQHFATVSMFEDFLQFPHQQLTNNTPVKLNLFCQYHHYTFLNNIFVLLFLHVINGFLTLDLHHLQHLSVKYGTYLSDIQMLLQGCNVGRVPHHGSTMISDLLGPAVFTALF